jgi:hypothetical protein
MLEVVLLYLGTGVACYNAASFLFLHPLTWDWMSLWIILYCCSIFFSNGCYGIRLVWRELSLKFAHSTRQQKVCLIIPSFFFVLLSCICQFAPFHLLIEDFNLQKKRHNLNKEFSHLSINPPHTYEKIRQLVETFKKRRQLDVHWKALQNLRADYYLWDQIMENFPQLILLILITNTQDTGNTVGIFSILLALSLWTWQRYLGYTCTVEGPLMLSGPSDLVAFFFFGFASNMIIFLQFLKSIYRLTSMGALEIISGLTYSSELEDKNGKFLNMSHVAFFMDNMPLLSFLLAAVLHFGGVAWINSDLCLAEKGKEAFATILFPLPHRDWMIPQGEPQRKTKMECLQDFLQFKRKLNALTLLLICKFILVFSPKVICDIKLFIHPLFQASCDSVSVIFLSLISIIQLWSLYRFCRVCHPSSMLLPSPPDFVTRISVFNFMKLLKFLFSDEEAKAVDQKEGCQQIQ